MMKKIKKVPFEFKLGLSLIIILVLIAVFSDQIISYSPKKLNDDILHPPSASYYFGTDGIGRDVFSMIITGTKTSLYVGLTAALISMLIGTIVGAIAGYFGGWIDRIIYEILNVFSMVPTLFLIIMVISAFGSSLRNTVIVIGLTSWTGTARLMRGQTKSLKERTFIKAARVSGESDFAILFNHIIPHGISPILVNAALSVSNAILYEASLAFIGLGDPNVISWGQLINNGRTYILSGWWVITFPGLAIVIIVIGFHLLAEGLNKMINPSN